MRVKYKGYRGSHDLTVVQGNGPSLLGRDWLSRIRLDWAEIGAVRAHEGEKAVSHILDKYRYVFTGGPGKMTHIKAHLMLREGARPRAHRPRQVPFALVGKELDRLEKLGVLRRVNHSMWALPIVPVHKKDGTIRVCGDYKVTINPDLLVDQYPLPKPTDLMACLTGGVCFTKLDLTSAYQQMELDEESRELVTMTTQQGLYQYTRLPFGVASAPAIFQRAMDEILQGLPGVICYLDDILITGRTAIEHHERLEEVMRRLQEHGTQLKWEKCTFCVDVVQYLGYWIDSRGVHTTEQKVQTLVDTKM